MTEVNGIDETSASGHNAPAIRAATDVSTDVETWDGGATQGLETTDLAVAKIFHMQSTSDLVKARKAQPGEFRDSLTEELLAAIDGALEVIVFGMQKRVVIKKEEITPKGQKWEFERSEIITDETAKAWALKCRTPWNEADNFTRRGSIVYDFQCLLPSKISELPYILSLGGTKSEAARKLNTMRLKLASIGKKGGGAGVVFEVRTTEEKNDEGSWAGVAISQGRDVTPLELGAAFSWYQKSRTQAFVAPQDEDLAGQVVDAGAVPL